MTDEELREALRAAHRDDAPPPFRLRARRPRHRAAWLAAAGLAVAAALFSLWPRVPPPPAAELAQVDLRWSAPLDFLLDVPGADLLRDTPRFDTKGFLP